jgi:Acyclic terpene utilisation family protein AtuA
MEKGEPDYVSFDFLAELTMALLQRETLKDPEAGYVTDVVGWRTKSSLLLPAWYATCVAASRRP